jgi:hypothetical protein
MFDRPKRIIFRGHRYAPGGDKETAGLVEEIYVTGGSSAATERVEEIQAIQAIKRNTLESDRYKKGQAHRPLTATYARWCS